MHQKLARLVPLELSQSAMVAMARSFEVSWYHHNKCITSVNMTIVDLSILGKICWVACDHRITVTISILIMTSTTLYYAPYTILYCDYCGDCITVWISQEYGITEPEKVEIGRMILCPLVRKLMADLKVASTDDTSDNPYRLNPSLVFTFRL